MYKAIDLANYIVDKCIKDNAPITNLQLQRILYFVQKEFLKRGSPAFSDYIEAWEFGPVDYDIYNEFEYDNEMFSIKQSKTLICDKFTRSFIDNYLDRIFITNDFGLIDLSHEDNAWRNVYNESMKHIKMNPESIINEYAKKKGVPVISCN